MGDDVLAIRAFEVEMSEDAEFVRVQRAASTASTLTASPRELGGWITAASTPAEAISASASSTE